MSDRIAVFNDGRIQQLDAPAELYEHPQNAFVAQFIGESNRLPGRVTAINGGICEVALDTGAQIRALAINVAGVGAQTVVSIRPERVVIDPPTAPGMNQFEAQIRELIYLGDHLQVRADLLGRSGDFVVKVPVGERPQHVQVGNVIKVGWPVDVCRALDA